MWTESTIVRPFPRLLQPLDAHTGLGSNDSLAEFPHNWMLGKVCEIWLFSLCTYTLKYALLSSQIIYIDTSLHKKIHFLE